MIQALRTVSDSLDPQSEKVKEYLNPDPAPLDEFSLRIKGPDEVIREAYAEQAREDITERYGEEDQENNIEGELVNENEVGVLAHGIWNRLTDESYENFQPSETPVKDLKQLVEPFLDSRARIHGSQDWEPEELPTDIWEKSYTFGLAAGYAAEKINRDIEEYVEEAVSDAVDSISGLEPATGDRTIETASKGYNDFMRSYPDEPDAELDASPTDTAKPPSELIDQSYARAT